MEGSPGAARKPRGCRIPDLLAGLNPEQRRAVEHSDGPLLVLAGPGSGKTRVITTRIAYQVRSRSAPANSIIGITFTHRAAEEMRARVRNLLGVDEVPRMGTFHWLAHSLLRRRIHRIGYSRDFRLLAPPESRQLVRSVIAGTPKAEAARITAALSAVKNGAHLDTASRRNGIDSAAVSVVLKAYDDRLRSMGALDLDDLIRLSVRLLRDDDETREMCRQACAELLVDEFQDTNPVQHEFLGLLTPYTGRVIAVGDEDQAIYGWRQADSRSMRQFLDRFPSSTVVHLNRSYRSTKAILRAASSLVSHNQGRLARALVTDNPAGERPVCYVADDELEEAEWVASEIGRMTGQPGLAYEDIAVLYRMNAQSRSLEDALVRHRIPYHVHGGQRFYERPEIRCAVAYLRVALEEDPEAALYLARCVPGIGPKRLDVLRNVVGERSVGVLETFADPPHALPERARQELTSIARRVAIVRQAAVLPLVQAVSAAIEAGAEGIDAPTAMEREAALENLEELRSIAAEFDARRAGIRDLVDRLSLGTDSPGRPRGVSLMTLHAAKGLEFSAVFVAGLEEGLLPHWRALDHDVEVEEERRLCYVGITRARQRVFLSYAHARLVGGQALLGHQSRFLGEIGSDNVTLKLSPRRAAKPRLASANVGERVSHPRWHAGTIVAVEGRGRDTLVSIDFDRGGRQRLQLCHAPLQRLESDQAEALAG